MFLFRALGLSLWLSLSRVPVAGPVPVLQTRVQASSATLSEVMADVPKLGLAGVYRGATPAIVGQFASHGLRTGMFEATRMLLKGLKPDLSEYQVSAGPGPARLEVKCQPEFLPLRGSLAPGFCY